MERFFFNLLSDTKYELKNRYTHVDYKQEENKIKLNTKYTLEEQAIINIIKDNENVKQEEIAILVHKSVRTIKTIMHEMQIHGIIKRVNGKKSGKWIVL